MPDAGRVIAGSARSIRLTAPAEGTRPFGDRVKQTLFAILDPSIRGARVLDLFAGSGAAGIEALSRGAALATFVERDRAAIAAIEANLARTHLAGSARVVRSEAVGWLRAQAGPVHPWDIVLLDPPYAEGSLLVRSLELLGDGALGLVAPGGRVVAKHFWRETPPAAVGLLASERERRFGETALTFYRRQEDV
jgi:16S rRNA (guanine966-N2)-methyltransferase